MICMASHSTMVMNVTHKFEIVGLPTEQRPVCMVVQCHPKFLFGHSDELRGFRSLDTAREYRKMLFITPTTFSNTAAMLRYGE